MVLAQIITQAGTDAPSLGQLICKVHFDRPGLEALVLDPLIALGRQAQAVRYGHLERAAVLLGVLDRCLARRRVATIDVLLIEGNATVPATEEIVQADAEVGAVCQGFRVTEQTVVGAMESESAIIGLLQTGEESFAPGGLQLEPGIRALPEGQVCSAEAVVGVTLPVGIGGQAKSHVVADPELALAADGDGVQTVETWRVLIT